jgi:hypothetical protein
MFCWINKNIVSHQRGKNSKQQNNIVRRSEIESVTTKYAPLGVSNENKVAVTTNKLTRTG